MTFARPLPALAALLACAAALAACSEAEITAPGEQAGAGAGGGGGNDASSAEAPAEEDADGERVSMAETGWLTIGADGSVYTTHFDADGTYRDYRNGEFLQSGTWRRREDGELCFAPAAQDRLGACWETEGLDDDGTMRARDMDGRAIRLRRVTYLPPRAAEDGGADGDADGTGDGAADAAES